MINLLSVRGKVSPFYGTCAFLCVFSAPLLVRDGSDGAAQHRGPG